MKPKEFPGVNVIMGRDQPEYLPLPLIYTPEGTCYSCWELSDQEVADIVKNRHFYIKQETFNRDFNPILPIANLEDGLFITKG